MITAIYIGTERLDLFEDENIVIKSTVAKIEDITKIFTDTSNDFTVPATDVNNDIFKHWYNPNLLNGFDARKKVPAVIELGGINFKVGKIRLEKVNLKSNQPYSYSLNFFGNLVELKDVLQDDKLTSLDLSSLDFIFNSDNVEDKLFDPPTDVCFSLLSKRRFLYDSVNSITDNNKQTNIYYDGTNNNTGIKASDLKASVKQLKVIEAIESKYTVANGYSNDIKFSRDFFNLYDFNSQFMALSGTEDSTATQIPLTTSVESTDNTVNGNTMLAEGYGTDAQRVTTNIQLGIVIDDAYKDVVYSFYIKSDDKVVGKKENVTGSFVTNNVLNVKYTDVNGGLKNVTFWLESSEPIVFNAIIFRIRYNSTFMRVRYNSGTVTPTINFNVANRMPNIKIIDYLKGLFMMSKLVAIPQKDGTIYVDSLVNYYKKGKVYDFTEYIDVEDITVSAGKILNEIKYKFEEPQTILNQQFVKNNGIGYGDLELGIYDENGILIDGDNLEFKLPFEQIVYEKIRDLSNDETDTNIQYGLLQDENLDFVTIKPHIHYIQRVSTSIKFIQDSGTAIDLRKANIPSHILDFSLQTFSTTFGSEFNTFSSELISNTIYTNYHKPYIESIFNKQKREVKYKAKDVPTHIVLKLQLNDVIQVKNNFYRINNFQVNTLDNNIDLSLTTDRVLDLSPLISITADSTILTADSTEITADSL